MKLSTAKPEVAESAKRMAGVLVSVIDAGDIEALQSAEILYREFTARGCNAVLDDCRAPGAQKLAEPVWPNQVRVHLDARWLAKGEVELRVQSGSREVKLEDAVEEAMRFFK